MEVLYFLVQLFLLPFFTSRQTKLKITAKYFLFRIPFYFLFGLIILFCFIVWWRALDRFYFRRFKKKRNTWLHKLERWWHYKTTIGLKEPVFAS